MKKPNKPKLELEDTKQEHLIMKGIYGKNQNEAY
jgi:hypothetical protein